MERNIIINSELDKGVLTVLNGNALDPKPPKVNLINGILDAPLSYLQKRNLPEEYQKKSHIIVDRHEGSLLLVLDERDHYRDEIKGQLKLNPDFVAFGINSGKQWETFEMADFIKMNRSFFDSKSTAMSLVSELKNFKAKVNKEIEQSENNRGNARTLKDQVVHSNIPESFDLDMEIFKRQGKFKFNVEIYIDSQTLDCTFISPDVRDIIQDLKDRVIDEQIEKIASICPGIAFMEV